jgi:peptidoglycan L-alanyl-D-glutamate endopeptidase CwlK
MAVTDQARSLDELHPKVATMCRGLLAEALLQGVSLMVTETYRSPERQEWLYASGRTRPGAVVTNIKTLGAHSFRVAFDVVPLTADKKANWNDSAGFAKAGAIGGKLGLEWGGNWKSPVDMPHFQFLGGVTLAQWRQGRRPPWWGEGLDAEKAAEHVTERKDEMNQLEFNQMLENAQETYNSADDCPGWARPTIQKLVDKGALLGTGGKPGEGLGLTEALVRMFVANDRMGLYG